MKVLGAFVVVVVIVASVGCLQASAVSCDDGRVCPSGTACDNVHGACVSPDQLVTCIGLADGTSCPIGAGTASGFCLDEVCVASGCGDRVAVAPEQCDGDVGGLDCTNLGYYRGALTCSATCTFELEQCEGTCGDAVLNSPESAISGPEACDWGVPAQASCFDSGFDYGRQVCNRGCGVDLGGCGVVGWDSVPSGTSATLMGIAGTESSQVAFAVGLGGTIVRFDGHTWQPALSPTTADLRAVSVASEQLAFAVGAQGTIVKWDGTSWSVDGSPATSSVTLAGVWVASPSFAYAVGRDSMTASRVALRWDGATWSVDPAAPGGTTMTGVWGTTSTDFYVTGYGTQNTSPALWHYSGTAPSWSQLLLSNAGSIQGSTATGVWGHNGRAFAITGIGYVCTAATATSTSATCESSGLSAPLSGIAGTSDTDAYVVGYGGLMSRSRDGGSTWARVVTGTTRNLHGIWAAGTGELYVVGDDGLIMRHTQASWTSRGIGGSYFDAGDASGTWDHLFIAGSSKDFAYLRRGVGSSSPPSRFRHRGITARLAGAMYEVFGVGYDNACGGGVERWDVDPAAANPQSSAAFTIEHCASTDDLFDIWDGGSILYAVGGRGGNALILRRDAGGSWQAVHVGATATLTGIWGSAADDIWAVGADAAILHFDGATWSTVRPPMVGRSLSRIWGSSRDMVIAAGDPTLRWNGVTWNELSPPRRATARYVDVWGTGPSDVFLIETSNTVESRLVHFDGMTWAPIKNLRPWAMRGLHGAGSDVFAFGPVNTFMRLDRACAAREASCTDRWDDDCDGLAGCRDPDCAEHPTCAAGGVCGPAELVTCGSLRKGSTFGGAQRIDEYTCGRSLGGPEAYYRFVATASDTVTVRVDGDLHDIVIVGSTSVGAQPACDPIGACIAAGHGEVTFQATAGTTYFFVIDSPAAELSATPVTGIGTFELDVSCD